MCKNTFSDSSIANKVQLHRSKCTNIIKNVLAPHFEKALLDDVNTGPFSILIDESNDISVTKMLGIAIIYFSKQSVGKLESTFLALAELDTCDSESIVAAVRETLRSKGLDIKYLKGIGVDNASVMSGVNNRVYAKLRSECPGLTMIRCVCHSLQLAVSSASDCLPTNLDFLVREPYNWFSHSALRRNAYKALRVFAAINDGHSPKKYCTELPDSLAVY
ncbi:hypothetical protein ANN_26873 [Periplaneta americana]|uniref:Uncharacterized protein n=1 Tax=Periplaneta americana TaxID=6978 RepID=A0ABQ8RWN2_PERAM|nr:hypothetical protein ANN_26873 [Periplaneta americana]